MTLKEMRSFLNRYCGNMNGLDFVCAYYADDRPNTRDELFTKELCYVENWEPDSIFKQYADKQVHSFEVWSNGIVVLIDR